MSIALMMNVRALRLAGKECSSVDHDIDPSERRSIGKQNAKLLAQLWITIDALSRATAEDLMAVDSIGPIVAQSIVEWFENPMNAAMLQEMHERGVRCIKGKNSTTARASTPTQASGWAGAGTKRPAGRPAVIEEVEAPDSSPVSGTAAERVLPLKGKRLVVTGSLEEEGLLRKDAEAAIEAMGGHLVSSVSKSTDMVVVGKNPGPKKVKDAERNGIPMVSEADFVAMFGMLKNWLG